MANARVRKSRDDRYDCAPRRGPLPYRGQTIAASPHCHSVPAALILQVLQPSALLGRLFSHGRGGDGDGDGDRCFQSPITHPTR
jgi:hypothetical protein